MDAGRVEISPDSTSRPVPFYYIGIIGKFSFQIKIMNCFSAAISTDEKKSEIPTLLQNNPLCTHIFDARTQAYSKF
jgi:hypothetical protein